MVYVTLVTYAAGRRELFVLQVHVPTINSIEEKFGFLGAGMGVLSTCAGAYAGVAAARSTAAAIRKR